MSKLTEKLRTVNIHNEYEFFGLQPYITYHAGDNGRGGQPARWMVFKRGVDLGHAWYDNGGRSFLRWGNRAEALAKAQAFVTEKFSIMEFARSPFGSYGSAEFVRSRIKELVQKADSLPVNNADLS
jgi:hypothetical protein